MRGDYIDFISSYCDRWCERCAFTMRCSAFSVEVATGMCDGDVKAAIELAVGAPPPRDDAEKRRREEFLEHLNNFDPTEQELEETKRDETASSSTSSCTARWTAAIARNTAKNGMTTQSRTTGTDRPKWR